MSEPDYVRVYELMGLTPNKDAYGDYWEETGSNYAFRSPDSANLHGAFVFCKILRWVLKQESVDNVSFGLIADDDTECFVEGFTGNWVSGKYQFAGVGKTEAGALCAAIVAWKDGAK